MGKLIHSVQRTASVLPWLFLIGIIGWALYTAFNKQTNEIIVEEGGKFTQINKTSKWFTLFTEVGVENQDNELGFYTRVGARIEF